ncbi:hypothetical protein ACFP65_01280 [Marinilactibacillus sp. GCM10026970]|uniref:hypothetical protein n=1 Tax=Marinilactibacillus sp. GCM10026970 TaxID=3252642 RepID=UPI00360B79E4
MAIQYDIENSDQRMNLDTLIHYLKKGREIEFYYSETLYFLDSDSPDQHTLWEKTTQIGEAFTDVTEENLSKLFIKGKSIANIFKGGEARVSTIF